VSLRWPRLFPDRLRIYMHPQAIHLTRLRTGPKRGVVRSQRLDIAAIATSEWQPACTALGTLLEQRDWQQAQPEVVLSNHFVRYSVIPWNESVVKPSERQAYMRHCFQAIYGEHAQAWDLRMHDAGYGRPALASAVDNALIASLGEVFSRVGMRLKGIHPQLMQAANGLATMPSSFWLAVIESGRLTIGLVDHDHWRLVKTMAVERDVERHLQAIIQRESLLHLNAASTWPVVCHWPDQAGATHFALPNRVLRVPSNPVAARAQGIFKLAVWQ
jgi:hypothetical protein